MLDHPHDCLQIEVLASEASKGVKVGLQDSIPDFFNNSVVYFD